MKTHTILALTLSLSTSGLLSAQFAGQAPVTEGQGGAVGPNGAVIAYVTGSIMNQKDKRFKVNDFQGTPYTSNEFKPTVLYDKGKKVGEFYYRYNAYNEEIEIKTSPTDDGVGSLSRDKTLSILEDGNMLGFKTFIDKNNSTLNGYLATLIDGSPYKLYQRTTVKYTEGVPAANSFVRATPNKFSQFTEYYIEKEGANRIDEIELSNRKILSLIQGSDKEKLKKYFKDNKFKVRDLADLTTVIELLNS